jgi:hypothetical protein
MKRSLCVLVLLLLLIFTACIPAVQPESEEPIDILFIGNSYTFVNDLPDIFARLAGSGDHSVNVTVLAKAGYSLNDHAEDPLTREVIQGNKWDYVILQEKSSLPVLDKKLMTQGFSQLVELAAGNDTEMILFMPWAYQAGFPEAGMADYHAMQSEVAETYLDLAHDFDITVAPVGLSWQAALERNPQLDLWSNDGSHPSLLGSYLAANTLYALIFQENPTGLRIPGTDSAHIEVLDMLGEIAAETVLGDPRKWKP